MRFTLLRNPILVTAALLATPGFAQKSLPTPSADVLSIDKMNAFENLICKELFFELGPDLDPDQLTVLQKGQAVKIDDAILAKVWPLNMQGGEPPQTGIMFPGPAKAPNVKDLDDALKASDWTTYSMQFNRLLGTLRGPDDPLNSSKVLTASLLPSDKYDQMATKLSKELGGKAADWRKAIPLIKSGAAGIVVRALAIFSKYSSQTQLKNIANNGLTNYPKPTPRTSASVNQYTGYSFNSEFIQLNSWISLYSINDYKTAPECYYYDVVCYLYANSKDYLSALQAALDKKFTASTAPPSKP